ncbi:unnamed protein product [Zymoseptoria tritici ST99CH_1A5]|uniref:Zn(2)-C6 fungal-type domain-containing protein n=1 Tax=Zymoseptoria tritici ST99CH_1A5 TaxID=1276529 RepID=A0A1Y6M0I5_ZYMTR|nr:unnamed protein product [Zymoseptoria tritici ST99CH_1A5]
MSGLNPDPTPETLVIGLDSEFPVPKASFKSRPDRTGCLACRTRRKACDRRKPGLLHGVLSLSATLLQAAEEIPNSAWKLRQAYYFGQALSLLRQGIERAASPANGGLEVDKLLVVQSLVLYLQVICEGYREGQDRSHLGGMKWIVSGTSISPHNVTFEIEVRMFILYHNYCSCLTSPSTPFDYDFWKLKNSL